MLVLYQNILCNSSSREGEIQTRLFSWIFC